MQSKGGNGRKVGSPTDVRVEANEVAAAEAGLSPDEPVTNAEGDTTPDEVHYIGYFNLGERCYRVDRPEVTHMVGRD